MASNETKNMLKSCVLPIMLGNGFTSHRLSVSIRQKFGCISLLCGKHINPLDIIDPSSMFYKLFGNIDEEFIIDQLLDLAKQYDDCLLLLIPCTSKYSKLINKHSDTLQSNFIISAPSELFTDTPLAFFNT